MRSKSFLIFLLLGVAIVALAVSSHAQVSVGISVRIGPPPLPVYVQPECPAPGYLWTPGYWAYGDDDYYWVPGTWVEPPRIGVLWTPGYWGWRNGFYIWNAGYWGPHVGFYGGINYGFGYTGVGFFGGRWHGREFEYNRAVTHVNVTIIHNTYHTTVINRSVNRVSFNGGSGGIRAVPTIHERHAEHERHFEATSLQTQHQRFAGSDRAQFASVNGGKPGVVASPKPGVFKGREVATGNRNADAHKFSNGNNTTMQTDKRNVVRGGNTQNSNNTFSKNGNPNSNNNFSRNNGNQNSNNNFAKGGNTHGGPDSRMTHVNNASSIPPPSRTYQTDARTRQNTGSQNNSNHGDSGGQHGHGKDHPDKH